MKVTPWRNMRILLKKSLRTSLLGIMVILCGCAGRIYDIAYPTLNDGQYDSEFPYKECSKQLEEMFRSVFRVSHMAYYETFVFSENHPVTYSQIKREIPSDRAVRKRVDNRGSAGTAILIFQSLDKLAFLTCAHVVDKPDTLITLLHEGEVTEESLVQSVSIKTREVIFVPAAFDIGELSVLAADHEQDIAILGADEMDSVLKPPAFGYPMGRSAELEWGDFVYVLGYPIGHQMVTRGIVSQPSMIQKKGCFLIDVNFNKGFSGGLVIAVRDGVPNFELVGMAKSVSAGIEYVLRPEKEVGEYLYDATIPYQGDVFVNRKTEINYGVTHVICVEAIKEFIEAHRESLRNQGYSLDDLFK